MPLGHTAFNNVSLYFHSAISSNFDALKYVFINSDFILRKLFGQFVLPLTTLPVLPMNLSCLSGLSPTCFPAIYRIISIWIVLGILMMCSPGGHPSIIRPIFLLTLHHLLVLLRDPLNPHYQPLVYRYWNVITMIIFQPAGFAMYAFVLLKNHFSSFTKSPNHIFSSVDPWIHSSFFSWSFSPIFVAKLFVID